MDPVDPDSDPEHCQTAGWPAVRVRDFGKRRGTSRDKNEIYKLFFLFLWVIFALLDPEPMTLIEPGSNPNPKHCP